MLKKLNSVQNAKTYLSVNYACNTCARICRVSRLEDAYNMGIPYIA